MTKGDFVLELVEVSEKSPLRRAGPVKPGLSHIAFLVDNIDEAVQELRNAGALILSEEHVVFGKIKFNYAKLKNDLILEVMEIPEGFEHAYEAL